MKRFFPVALVACSALASLILIAQEKPADSNAAPRYTEKKPSRDGTGKVYMGRETAQVVSFHAIQWLERKERTNEEDPEAVIRGMALKPNEVVADIGAGSGYFTFMIAKEVPQGKVIAVDINERMLEFIDIKREKLKLDNVEGLLGTIEDTKLPEGQVDAVLMVDAYHEFSHPYEMMQSIFKGLKPGGRVVLLEYRGEDPSVPIKPLHKMTEKQSILEMEAVGLKHQETKNFLPRQHLMVFVKPE